MGAPRNGFCKRKKEFKKYRIRNKWAPARKLYLIYI